MLNIDNLFGCAGRKRAETYLRHQIMESISPFVFLGWTKQFHNLGSITKQEGITQQPKLTCHVSSLYIHGHIVHTYTKYIHTRIDIRYDKPVMHCVCILKNKTYLVGGNTGHGLMSK